MALPLDFLERLISRNDIVDVVSQYVTLKKAGRTYVGLCPFHNEKSPSMHVYPESNSFYCFGCGAGGDVINFVRKIENLDYIEAVKQLASRSGLEVPQQNRIDDGYSKIRLRVYEANREAARFFHSALKSEGGKDALTYLRNRQLSDSTIVHFGLGYSPNSWDSLCKHLKSKGFSESEMITANLAVQSRNGGVIDRFRNRVMFPIIDRRSNVIAFGGRTMEKDFQGGKYLNTSDTPVYEKGRELYAMNFAKNSKEKHLILAEGYMDVIAMHQAGFDFAIASLGTALTTEQANIISRYVKEVIICYDSDEAGQKATQRAIPILRSVGLTVRILNIPMGKDPDEFIKLKGKERFQNLIEQSGNDIEYRLNKEKANYNTNNPQGQVDFLKSAVKLLSTLKNSVEQEIYATKLSTEFNVSKDSLLRQISAQQKREQTSSAKKEIRQFQRDTIRPKDTINPQRSEYVRATRAEEALIAYLIKNPDRISPVSERLKADEFCTDFNKSLYNHIIDENNNNIVTTISTLAQYYSVDEVGKITQIVVNGNNNTNTTDVEEDYINVIKEEKKKQSVGNVAEMDDSSIQDLINSLRNEKNK